jgi:hypothetical protein
MNKIFSVPKSKSVNTLLVVVSCRHVITIILFKKFDVYRLFCLNVFTILS